MNKLNLDQCFTDGEPRMQLNCGLRSLATPGGLKHIQDAFEGADCLFVRADSECATLALEGQYKVKVAAAGGWLVVPVAEGKPTYWLPRMPIRRKRDKDVHILAEMPAAIDGIETDISLLALRIGVGEGVLDFVIWRLDDPQFIEELGTLNPLEMQAWYLWGSHTIYARPADLYQHLIHGHVYENRTAWPHFWKICSDKTM